ncbi:MAG: cupredoxin domain-containing protein [Polyangiaceae bacterium]
MNRSAVLFASLLLGSLVALGCGKADANAAPAAAGSGEPSAVAETATGRVVEIKVTDNGFEPKVVEAKKGETVSLKFIRSTKSECLKAISDPFAQDQQGSPHGGPPSSSTSPPTRKARSSSSAGWRW